MHCLLKTGSISSTALLQRVLAAFMSETWNKMPGIVTKAPSNFMTDDHQEFYMLCARNWGHGMNLQFFIISKNAQLVTMPSIKVKCQQFPFKLNFIYIIYFTLLTEKC